MKKESSYSNSSKVDYERNQLGGCGDNRHELPHTQIGWWWEKGVIKQNQQAIVFGWVFERSKEINKFKS